MFSRRTNQAQGYIHQGPHSSQCEVDFGRPFYWMLHDHENVRRDRAPECSAMFSVVPDDRENGTVPKRTGGDTNVEIPPLARNGHHSRRVILISLCAIQTAAVVLQRPDDSRVCIQCLDEPL